jgi:CheY-like chemotaxis protein
MTGQNDKKSTPNVVVSVGQCGYDNARIRSFVRDIDPSIDVRFADDLDETRTEIERAGGQVKLVLVNRILDNDGSSGLEAIRTIKTAPDTAAVAVMLISNYEDAQAAAIAEGAVPGFGKSGIGSAAARERLAAVLTT